MFNISADKELSFALEMAKRTVYATNINGLDPTKFTLIEKKEYFHANKIALEYYNQIQATIQYVLFNKISVINDEFDNAIQDLNHYVYQIEGVVSNLAIANEVLSFLEKIILVLSKI